MKSIQPAAQVKVYETNDCLIDLRMREVVVGFEAVKPSREVFDTLVYLIDHRDQIVTLDALRQHVWRSAEATEFEVVRAIANARRLIMDDQERGIIEYFPEESGWRYNAEVLELEIN